MEKISIVLLNYNGYEDTIECINSIKENINSLNFEYEIVVVDNKSTNDSVEKLKEIDNIKLIEAKKNGGFAARK